MTCVYFPQYQRVLKDNATKGNESTLTAPTVPSLFTRWYEGTPDEPMASGYEQGRSSRCLRLSNIGISWFINSSAVKFGTQLPTHDIFPFFFNWTMDMVRKCFHLLNLDSMCNTVNRISWGIHCVFFSIHADKVPYLANMEKVHPAVLYMLLNTNIYHLCNYPQKWHFHNNIPTTVPNVDYENIFFPRPGLNVGF